MHLVCTISIGISQCVCLSVLDECKSFKSVINQVSTTNLHPRNLLLQATLPFKALEPQTVPSVLQLKAILVKMVAVLASLFELTAQL